MSNLWCFFHFHESEHRQLIFSKKVLTSESKSFGILVFFTNLDINTLVQQCKNIIRKTSSAWPFHPVKETSLAVKSIINQFRKSFNISTYSSTVCYYLMLQSTFWFYIIDFWSNSKSSSVTFTWKCLSESYMMIVAFFRRKSVRGEGVLDSGALPCWRTRRGLDRRAKSRGSVCMRIAKGGRRSHVVRTRTKKQKGQRNVVHAAKIVGEAEGSMKLKTKRFVETFLHIENAIVRRHYTQKSIPIHRRCPSCKSLLGDAEYLPWKPCMGGNLS